MKSCDLEMYFHSHVGLKTFIFYPDMPAGEVSLTMYTERSSVSLRPVTYYTNMGEVSRYLENATDPVNFFCQVRHHVMDYILFLSALFISKTPGYMSHCVLSGLQLDVQCNRITRQHAD